jgi:hypothetical protein
MFDAFVAVSVICLWVLQLVALGRLAQLRRHEQEHCSQIGDLQDTVEWMLREYGMDREALAAAIESGELRK